MQRGNIMRLTRRCCNVAVQRKWGAGRELELVRKGTKGRKKGGWEFGTLFLGGERGPCLIKRGIKGLVGPLK